MEMLLANKRIYIVEDQSGNLAIIKTLLELNGATVNFERWGLDVPAKLKAFLPLDIILLDLMYPRNVTGYDVFDQIRKIEDYNNIPIVAVSASEPSVAIPKTRNQGFDGFIAKPIEYDLFPNQIYEILLGNPIWFAGKNKIR